MSDLIDRLKASARDLRSYAEMEGVRSDLLEAAARLAKLEELLSLASELDDSGHLCQDDGRVKWTAKDNQKMQRFWQLLEELKDEGALREEL